MHRPIIYYNDNPNRPKILKVDSLLHGKEYRINCCLINGSYYVKGKDLEWLDDIEEWVPITPKVLDNETGLMSRKKELIAGIIGFDSKGEKEIGYYSRNPLKNCKVLGGLFNKHDCIDYKLLENSGKYIEDYSRGSYKNIENLIYKEQEEVLSAKKLEVNNQMCQYNVADDNDSFQEAIQWYDKHNVKIDRDVRFVSSYLKGITFGVEVEVINGFMPKHLLTQLGLIVCKDGSIKTPDNKYPPEYVSIPLSGAKGIQSLRNALHEIGKRSDIDLNCSLHLHLGGFVINRLFLVSLYRLATKIQDELYEMFPKYKENDKKYANKEKAYCKKIPDIIDPFTPKERNYREYICKAYEDLYTYLTGGKKFDKEYNVKHKKNPWGNHKWDIPTRYHWINFINPIFGKQQTIEFRLHTPTLNDDKAINWLLITNAIIQYAIKNSAKCVSKEKISIKDVLSIYETTNYGKTLSTNLSNYIEERTRHYKKATDNGDYLCVEDITEDKYYKFNTIKIKS